MEAVPSGLFPEVLGNERDRDDHVLVRLILHARFIVDEVRLGLTILEALGVVGLNLRKVCQSRARLPVVLPVLVSVLLTVMSLVHLNRNTAH